MKRGRSSSGFTIIEVMIFLAVSMGLLAAALLLINGHEHTTEFTQSTNDIKSQVDQVINNVASGYYANSKNFTCDVVGGGYKIAISATDTEGTNQNCIFIGRAMQFGVSGTNLSGFNVFNLIGHHYKSSAIQDDIVTLTGPQGAEPIALSNCNNPPVGMFNTYQCDDTIHFPDTTQSSVLQYGLQVYRMKYTTAGGNAPATINTDTVAFVTDFAQSAGAGGGLQNGARQADLYVVGGASVQAGQTAQSAVDQIDSLNAANFLKVKKVSVCFDGGTAYYAILDIGGDKQQLTTNMRVVGKSTSPTECS